MTELLASFAEQLAAAQQGQMAAEIAKIASGYKFGEISYQQAMARLTDVVGRPALVAEVCRLSKRAGADPNGISLAATGSQPPAGAQSPSPAPQQGEGVAAAPAAASDASVASPPVVVPAATGELATRVHWAAVAAAAMTPSEPDAPPTTAGALKSTGDVME
eukprot:6488945-Prymnesium_polylepis.1